MASERVDISVLVVDDDETSLANVANILNSLEYKVLTAKGALHALETLREFGGFLDIVITELHMSGMNGFEFLNRVECEFKLPVIMMSEDRRKNVISNSLANGAAHYILKPFCANDFKDIWHYAIAARKRKLGAENNEGKSLKSDGIFIQDVNSETSANENKKKRKYCQRKSTQMNNENQSEGRPPLVKKPKILWTTHLHNLFLHAIKEIGLERAVPKRILEIMNMPTLTRENVASHLQKYRIFLRKVSKKVIFEGLSNRDLKSRFASGLTTSMIEEFQARNAKLNFPALQYMKRAVPQTEYREITNALQPYNHVSRSTTPLGRCHQFPYPYHKSLNMMLHNQHGDSLNQARLGVQSSYGTNPGANNIQQNMFGSYANSPYLENISNNNVGSVFPSMEHGLMTSAKGLRDLKYGDHQLMNQNYGSLGNYHHKFNYGQGNWNMGSLNNFDNNLPSSSSTYNPSSNIQLDGGSQMVGNGIKGGFNSTIGDMDSIANNNNSFGDMDSIANNNNSFSLINETTQNANKNVAPLGQGNFGLAQEENAFAFASSAEDEWSSELPATLITDSGAGVENLSGNTQMHQQLDGNVEENVNPAMLDDLPDILMFLDEMDLLIEPEENPDANEFSKSGFSGSSHIVQSLEQSNSIVSDVTANPIESTINFPNESPISSDKNCNQLGDDGGFADMGPLDRFMVDGFPSASNSTIEQDWDIDLIEALFGDGVTK